MVSADNLNMFLISAAKIKPPESGPDIAHKANKIFL